MTFHKVDHLMKEAVDRYVFPGGVLLVAIRGSVVFQRAYGWADLFSRRQMTGDTVFDLASLTKPLATTLAAMRLVQRGDLELDLPCQRYWPRLFRAEKASITARHLLSHSSGLPPWRPYYLRLRSLPDCWRRKEVLAEWIAQETLLASPGNRACYSDIGFLVLQWLVERLAGQPMDRYLEGSIFKPLGIKDLFFNPEGKPVNERVYAATELCPWRGRLLLGRVHDDNAYVLGGVGGHAGLFGTAQAVWKALQTLLCIDAGACANTVFDKVLLRRFLQRQNGTMWALGFDTPEKTGSSAGRHFSSQSVGHLGFTGTSFWMDRKRGIILILLTNRVHPSRYNLGIRSFRPLIHDAVMEAVNSVH